MLDRDLKAALAQIGKDFGTYVGTPAKWLREECVEQVQRPGIMRSENDELRELRKRNNLVEREVEELRRVAA